MYKYTGEVHIMSELFIVIFVSVGVGIFQICKYLLLSSPGSFYFSAIAIVILTAILIRFLYTKIRFRNELKKLNLDYYDFKFYKTCSSFFNKTSYVISTFLYNTISEYKFTVKDFSVNKNYNKEMNETDYYLKLRLRWSSYIKFTFTRIKIALIRADDFSFDRQNAIIEKSLLDEEREIYLNFKESLKNIDSPKINLSKLNKLENSSSVNYIYKCNLVKLHNNKAILKKYIDRLNFMNKKLEQFSNDVRSYKRTKSIN